MNIKKISHNSNIFNFNYKNKHYNQYTNLVNNKANLNYTFLLPNNNVFYTFGERNRSIVNAIKELVLIDFSSEQIAKRLNLPESKVAYIIEKYNLQPLDPVSSEEGNNVSPAEKKPEPVKERNEVISELDKKVLRHFRNPNNSSDSIRQFCWDNNIFEFIYNDIVQKHISAEEIEELNNLKKQKQKEILEKRKQKAEIQKQKSETQKKNQVSSDINEKILEHFRDPNNGRFSIKQFCTENNISYQQYYYVVKGNISVEEIEKIKQRKKEIQKQKIQQQNLQNKLAKEKQTLSELDKKILEHYKNPNNETGSIKQFCEENNISTNKYYIVIKANTTVEERKNLKILKEKIKKEKVETEKIQKKQERLDNLKEKILELFRDSNNGYDVIVKFCKENNINVYEYDNIVRENISSEEINKLNRQRIEKHLSPQKQKMQEKLEILAHYRNPNNGTDFIKQFCEEHNISKSKYVSIVKRNIPVEERKKIIKQRAEIEKNKKQNLNTILKPERAISSRTEILPSYDRDRLINISLQANASKAEIDEANKKLKENISDNIVFLIKKLIVINIGKYGVQYYMHNDSLGKREESFNKNEEYILEFTSDRKNAYKTFIDKLIERHKV